MKSFEPLRGAGRGIATAMLLLNLVASALAQTTPGAGRGCAQVPLGLVGWWQAEGNGNDVTGAHNGTTPFGMTYVQGEVGQAFSYHYDSYDMTRVTIPDSPDFKLTSSMTIEAWIYPKAACFYVFFRGDDRSGLDPYSVDCRHAGTIGFGIDDLNGHAARVEAPIQYNQWQHVAATLDGATGDMRMYVNGVLGGQINTSVRPAAELDPAYDPGVGIGNVEGTFQTWPFNGMLDEVALYSRALSPDEILAIYNAGTVGKCFIATPPAITNQPASQTVTVGGSVNFSVGASGTPPMTYQWRLDGTNLVGQTSASLALGNVQLADAGSYSVVVRNSVGSVTSSDAVLTVRISTGCVTPPAGLIGWWQAEGNGRDVTGAHHGTTPFGMSYVHGEVGQAFSYHYDNYDMTRVTIPDSPDFKLTNSMTIEAWIYPRAACNYVFFRGDDRPGLDPYSVDCRSTERIGFTIDDLNGNSARVEAPIQYNQWQHVAATLDGATGEMRTYVNGRLGGQINTSVRPGAELDPAYNPGVGIGNVEGRFQTWPFNGMIDEVALYSRALSQSEIQGQYDAGSAGRCLCVTPPAITNQPASQVVNAGGSASLSVGASGTAPLSYQWRMNGTNLIGRSTALLSVAAVQLADAGIYSVVVSNGCGVVTSADAVLNLIPVAPAGPVLPVTLQSMTNRASGVRLSFTGPAGKAYVAQASTNLVDWEPVGLATNSGNGTFEFEEAKAAGYRSRFYRITAP